MVFGFSLPPPPILPKSSKYEKVHIEVGETTLVRSSSRQGRSSSVKLKLAHYQLYMFTISKRRTPTICQISTGGQTLFKTFFAPAASFADAPHFGPPHFRLEAQSQEFPPG